MTVPYFLPIYIIKSIPISVGTSSFVLMDGRGCALRDLHPTTLKELTS